MLEFDGITELASIHMRTDYYFCPAGLEKLLYSELQSELPGARHEVSQPGLLRSEFDDADPPHPAVLAFVTQALPHANLCNCNSISEWAELILSKLTQIELSSTWHLHCFDAAFAAVVKQPQRPRLIRKKLEELLARKLRSARRTLQAAEAPAHAGDLVQLALLSPSSAILSVLPSTQRTFFSACLNPFQAGAVPIPNDKFPPSRAYRKLLEAELLIGRNIGPGETCVDLGAAPGGWSAVVLSRQALLTAVDRSPLRDDLMRNPGLTFQKGDGFKFMPKQTVDWLLCDIIAYPQRTLELLSTWLKEKCCRAFVVTLKFKGTPDLKTIAEAKRLLAAHSRHYLVRHLQSNKNEVALVGEL
ncbi:MAG: hypothetical protein K1X79_12165 [Oligoflexia bacterium]|nr:hypothetical protein [Oligoflexia bacterium]